MPATVASFLLVSVNFREVRFDLWCLADMQADLGEGFASGSSRSLTLNDINFSFTGFAARM